MDGLCQLCSRYNIYTTCDTSKVNLFCIPCINIIKTIYKVGREFEKNRLGYKTVYSSERTYDICQICESFSIPSENELPRDRAFCVTCRDLVKRSYNLIKAILFDVSDKFERHAGKTYTTCRSCGYNKFYLQPIKIGSGQLICSTCKFNLNKMYSKIEESKVLNKKIVMYKP